MSLCFGLLWVCDQSYVRVCSEVYECVLGAMWVCDQSYVSECSKLHKWALVATLVSPQKNICVCSDVYVWKIRVTWVIFSKRFLFQLQLPIFNVSYLKMSSFSRIYITLIKLLHQIFLICRFLKIKSIRIKIHIL